MTDQSTGLKVGGLSPGELLQAAKAALKRGDMALALGVVAIIVMMIFPMPTFLLDIFLAISITFSVMILMTVMFLQRPIDFSAFPSVLLVSTLLRLALNLSSTRLILSNGHEGTDAAGHVIEAFAGFVMGGDFLIGVVVFSILTMVNFVVITKGSGRIAEVAARFTLDAMPGKQMAIDADLSAGMIDEAEAKRRRKELEEESQFFGSMDGASKFVRGDAVAGLIMTAINVLGGVLIGMLRHDMGALAAADVYVKLTIGDGLVAQIPALLVSVAAGMLVSKGASTGSTDKALIGQLTASSMGLGLTSGLLAFVGVLPGMPLLPFALLACAVGAAAYYLPRQRAKKQAEEQKASEALQLPGPAAPVAEEPIATALSIDLLRLELGYALLSLINSEQPGARMTDQIKGLRRQLASEIGFVMPSVRIQDNLQLPPNTYVIRIKEIEAGRGDIRPNMLLVMDPRGENITLAGERTTEPTFGLPAMWVDPSYREEALFRGLTVVDPSTVVVTHLTEVIKDNMSEMLSYAETQKLLDELDRAHQKLVADVVPAQITVSGLQRILQNLLAERISIRDLPTILEGVSEACGFTRNITSITEHVRGRLARQISDANTSEAGVIPLVTLSPEWEQAFAEALVGDGEERQLSMAPTQLQQFITSVRQVFERHAMMGETPVLLTSPGIRPYVRSIVERFRPATVVMSQNEIHPKARIRTLGQI